MIAPYNHVLLLAILLFLMGAVCAVSRRNLIMILIGVEIMLNASGLVFVGASLHWQKLDGQIFFLFVLAVAASEVAIGRPCSSILIDGQNRWMQIATI